MSSGPSVAKPFSEGYPELGELCYELKAVREHNLKFKEWRRGYLMFSEAMLVLLTMERFLRIILGSDAGPDDTLPNLLEKATSKRRALITLPGTWTRERAIKAIRDVRNTLMHGNYEQAAQQANRRDVRDYFSSSTYTSEVESLFQVLDNMMGQIDPATGKPRQNP
jgi:hypothetical protein